MDDRAEMRTVSVPRDGGAAGRDEASRSPTRCSSSWESNGFFRNESAPAARAWASSNGSKVPTSSSTGVSGFHAFARRQTS
jgi:hypothetical protein